MTTSGNLTFFDLIVKGESNWIFILESLRSEGISFDLDVIDGVEQPSSGSSKITSVSRQLNGKRFVSGLRSKSIYSRISVESSS